jgi:hypothetical protein
METAAPVPVRLPRRAARLRGYVMRPLSDGARFVVIDLAAFCRATGLSYRTAQMALAELRTDPQFAFSRVRIGRSFRVRISLRNPSYKGGFSLTRKTENTKSRRGSWHRPATKPMHAPQAAQISIHFRFAARTDPRRAARLAAFLARNALRNAHWDNCKVSWNFGYAYRYARRMIAAGFTTAAIATAYDRALHKRHQDATDYDLNHGRRLVRWLPSSTVSLAETMLRNAA